MRALAERMKFQSLIGRLKTDRALEIPSGLREFQSLIGRLKTQDFATDPERKRARFNPS